MQSYAYKLGFKVRDYELDIEGIVNNATYLNYLEHARHQFLISIGIDFAEFVKKGINLIVIRTEIDYKQSLRSDDDFWVGVSLRKESPLKFAFLQGIYRSSDDQLIVKAKVVGVAVNNNGRPIQSQELEQAIAQHLGPLE